MHISEALKLAYVCICIYIYICKIRSSSRMTDFTFEPLCASYQHCRQDMNIHGVSVLNKLPVYLSIFYNFNGTWNGNKYVYRHIYRDAPALYA